MFVEPQVLLVFYISSKILLLINIRVRQRGAVPPKMKKTKNPKFSQKGHEKRKLNSEFRHPSIKSALEIAINVLCSKIP